MSTAKNLSALATHQPPVSFDTFRQCLVIAGECPWGSDPYPASEREWTDIDDYRLEVWLDQEHGLEPQIGQVRRAIEIYADDRKVDTLVNELVRYGERWDGVPRLETLCEGYLGAPPRKDQPREYLAMIGRRWMISAAVRGLSTDATQVDSVLVLEGPKGIGKTSFARIIGGEHYSNSAIAIGSKDGYLTILGTWIQELGELASIGRARLEAVKDYLTSMEDKYRVPYKARTTRSVRRLAFIATTNDAEYLIEGDSRRWLPVYCEGPILKEQLIEDRQQLIGEAVTLAQQGVQHWITDGAEQDMLDRAVELRRCQDPWEQSVEDYLEQSSADFHATDELLGIALGIGERSRKPYDNHRLSKIMQGLGWVPTRKRIACKNRGAQSLRNIRGYRRAEPTAADCPFM